MMCQVELRKRLRRIGFRPLASLVGMGMVAFATTPTLAAERIQFFVGPFEPTLWVDDLAVFATDGTITERFRPFARSLSDSQLQELRTFLNQDLDVDLLSVSQFTYWQVGERFLDRMGQVVQTDSFNNGSRALRAALIAAAADGDGITTLEVMEEFPLETMQLDFFLLQQIIQENRQFFANREGIIRELRAIGEAEAASFPVPVDSSDPAKVGPFTWQRETLTLQNPLREGNIPFDVYLPDASIAAKTPVVVISHGVASNRWAFVYLAEHLASHGYAVVVPLHDDDSQKYVEFLAGVDQPPNPITLVSRPRDISLALDTLERLAQENTAYRDLDLNNVGVWGHSLGGFTVLAAAGAKFNFAELPQYCSLEERNRPSLNPSLLVQCDLLDLAADAPFQLRDQRIRAVFALNPPTSLFFGAEGLAQVEVPSLFMAASADIVVPAVPEQIEPYVWLGSQSRYLVVMENATHFSPIGGNATAGAIPMPTRLLGPDPQLAHPYIKALSLAFFNRHLVGQTAAEGFLTQPYLDSLGTDPFQTAIIRNPKVSVPQPVESATQSSPTARPDS